MVCSSLKKKVLNQGNFSHSFILIRDWIKFDNILAFT